MTSLSVILISIHFVKGANNYGVHKASLWPQTSNMNTYKAFKVFLNQIIVQKNKHNARKQDNDRARPPPPF